MIFLWLKWHIHCKNFRVQSKAPDVRPVTPARVSVKRDVAEKLLILFTGRMSHIGLVELKASIQPVMSSNLRHLTAERRPSHDSA